MEKESQATTKITTQSVTKVTAQSTTQPDTQPDTQPAIQPTTQPTTQAHVPLKNVSVSQKNVQQKRKPIVLPISPLSSYKSIIIVLCTAILFWMLLQGGNKRDIKDIFRRRQETTTPSTTEKVQPIIDSTKDTIKSSYEKAAESTKTTFQNIADKVKNLGDNMKSMYDEKMNLMHDSVQENKDYLKGRVGETAEDIKQTTKGTIESLKEKSQETLDSVKAKSQETFDNVRTTSQETFDNIRTTSQETVDKAKEKIIEAQTNFLQRLDMVGLIDQAYSNLREFLSPHLKVEEQIPFKAFSGAKAVVFLTVVKGGLGLGGTIGSGIIIARNEIGHWSGPCAIALAGVDIGLNIGVEKSDHIIILRDDTAIRAFSGKGQFKLGMDASIAIGPTGRDATVGFSVGDKGYSSMFSYSLAKGAYIGISFEGQVITARDECNEEYYGKKVDAGKILDGTIKPPKNKHLTKIHKIIDEYAARNLVYPEHSTDL